MTGRAIDSSAAMIWCEHCRGHYPSDHYGADGQHMVGVEYGPMGYDLACVAIVERIAAGDWRAMRDASALVKAAGRYLDTEPPETGQP